MIDPDLSLTNVLLSKGVLDDSERQNVKNRQGSVQERNDVLLNLVLQKDNAVQGLTESLRVADQQHVCNFIHCEGGNIRPRC